MKVRIIGGKEIPLIQGRKQRLSFAGAALKRYTHRQGKRNPSKMVGIVKRSLEGRHTETIFTEN